MLGSCSSKERAAIAETVPRRAFPEPQEAVSCALVQPEKAEIPCYQGISRHQLPNCTIVELYQ